MGNVIETIEKQLDKIDFTQVTIQDFIQHVNQLLQDTINDEAQNGLASLRFRDIETRDMFRTYIDYLYSDRVIVNIPREGKYFEVPMEIISWDEINFGDPVEVERTTVFVPIGEMTDEASAKIIEKSRHAVIKLDNEYGSENERKLLFSGVIFNRK